jgi:hypothetical protein
LHKNSSHYNNCHVITYIFKQAELIYSDGFQENEQSWGKGQNKDKEWVLRVESGNRFALQQCVHLIAILLIYVIYGLSTYEMLKEIDKKKRKLRTRHSAHACVPSYSEGRNWEDHILRPTRSKIPWDPILVNKS